MKHVVVRQTGVAETEVVRELALEVPDDWSEEDVESLTLKVLESEDEIEWKGTTNTKSC